MKQLPILFALLAIGASGFAVPPQPVLDRTKTVPLVEPISICIDDLALPVHNHKAFKESDIPSSIGALDGKRVRMVGMMFPTFEETGITEFAFNGDTKFKTYSWTTDPDLIPIQYFILVTMRDVSTTSWTTRPIEIEGRFLVEPRYEQGILYNLYRIDNATVRPGKRQTGFHQSVGIGC